MSEIRPVVLNIDDDNNDRELLSRYLTKAGFQVVEAATGAEGIRLAVEFRPELILLDVRLPDLNGFEVCRRLRENAVTAHIPILQVSASYRDEAARVQSLEAGADAYLMKPVERERLLTTVNSLLRLRKAEEQVRNTAAEWATAFNALQDGVALLDRDGRTMRANERYKRLSMEHKLDCDALFKKLQATRMRQSNEQSDGDSIILLHLDPVLNPEGLLTGAVCTASDITDRKRFEDRLQHAQKLESIGVLAGGIAHDFNNLLTGILGNASLLLDELPSGSPGFEMAQEIVKASESAADLTRQMLAYAGKGRFVMQLLNLSEQIAANRVLLTRLIPRGIQLEFNLAEDLPSLEADATQLQQIVMNLVINAAEAYGERGKGKVVISTASEPILKGDHDFQPGEYILLSVRDWGSGMAADVRARIFDPFFTTKFAGRGLGLSAVHGILRAHHGHLKLETSPGQGTTFRLYLPAVAQPVAPREADLATEATSSGRLILVIDDEVTIRTFAEAALTKLGFEVILADNGQDGVDIVTREKERLAGVVLDLAMPVMDGEEALERIHQIAPQLPILVSTGFNMSSEYERLSRKGATGFLPKPFTLSQLSHALQRF